MRVFLFINMEKELENQIRRFQEIAGVGPQDDGPEEDNSVARALRHKAKERDDEEAENAERESDDELDENIGEVVINIPENTGYKDFAVAVANQLKDGYGKHNFKPFLQALVAELKKEAIAEDDYSIPANAQSGDTGTMNID